MHNESVIITEQQEDVGWIRLNRPEKRNALNADLVYELEGALDAFEHNDEIGAIVITGTGDSFSAGGDLEAFEVMDEGDKTVIPTFLDRAAACIERFTTIEKPVIAALNGITVAGGLEIALACDVVIASRRATLGDGHVNVGLIPGAGGAVRLAKAIGPHRAKYLTFSGRRISAEEFMGWGMIAELVEHDRLDGRAQELAQQMSGHSRTVLATSKRLIDDSLDQSLATALRAERTAVFNLFGSSDLLEGLAAFREKRRPEYR